MNNFIRLLAYVKRYTGAALLNIVFNIFAVTFSVVSVIMLIPFMELLFDLKTPVPEAPSFSLSPQSIIDYFYYQLGYYMNEFGKEEALIYFCLVVIFVFFLKNLFRYLAVYFMASIRNGVVKDIRNDLYSKLLKLPLAFYSKEKKGDIISRLTTDIKEVEYSIMSTLEVIFKEPLAIIISLGFMFYWSPKLTIFVLVMIMITAVIIGQIGKSLKRQSTKGQERAGTLTTFIDETISGLRIIKAFNAESHLEEKFKEENRSYFRIMNHILRKRDLSSPLSEFLAICIIAIILWYGGRLVMVGDDLKPQIFIGFIAIFSQLIPPAKGFATAFYKIQKGLASSERIYELLDASLLIEEPSNPIPIQEFNDSIEFKNVSFAYYNYDDKKVLDNLSLTIKKGKMVALVGQSGAGKTTLADLLPRFYDPTEGEILIDGINIKKLGVKQLRNLMSIVSQESILFNDTVYNNIAFGVNDVSKEDVKKAAEIANAQLFIEKLEHGYDTLIGDSGSNLSGGERQRLTIARAVLKNPPILILDEATSSLDSESEKLVQDALVRLMKNRTSIVIAHRLSTIQFADEIVVMQNGKIAERGNHIGLMAKNGLYKRLVELQQF